MTRVPAQLHHIEDLFLLRWVTLRTQGMKFIYQMRCKSLQAHCNFGPLNNLADRQANITRVTWITCGFLTVGGIVVDRLNAVILPTKILHHLGRAPVYSGCTVPLL